MRHFRKTQDRPDDVVEIVRDPAREGADGFHPPGLMQARFQPFLVLLENLSSNRVGDGVERHMDEAKLIPSRQAARLQRIEAEDSSPLCTGARNAQPAVEPSRGEDIHAVAASRAIYVLNMDGSVLASSVIRCKIERALRPARRKLCSVAAPPIDVHRIPGCNEIGAVGTDAGSQFSERAFDVSGNVVMLRVDKPRRDSGNRVLEFRAPLQRHCTRSQP